MPFDKSHFSHLCLLSRDELVDYSRRVNSLIEIVYGGAGAPPLVTMPITKTPEMPQVPPDAATTPEVMTSMGGVPPRREMRAPKPGTIRAAVHQALRDNAQAMHSRDIISSAARLRGLAAADDLFTANVREVLGNRADHFIRKVARSTYEFVSPVKGGDGLCQ